MQLPRIKPSTWWSLAVLIFVPLGLIAFVVLERYENESYWVEVKTGDAKEIVSRLQLYAKDHGGKLPLSLSPLMDDQRYGFSIDDAMGYEVMHNCILLRSGEDWTHLASDAAVVSLSMPEYRKSIFVYPDLHTKVVHE